MTNFENNRIGIIPVIVLLFTVVGCAVSVMLWEGDTVGGLAKTINEDHQDVLAKIAEVDRKIDASSDKQDVTNIKVQDLADGQAETHEWVKNISVKVDQNTQILQRHDLELTKQGDKIDEIGRAVDKDAAANRASQDAK